MSRQTENIPGIKSTSTGFCGSDKLTIDVPLLTPSKAYSVPEPST